MKYLLDTNICIYSIKKRPRTVIEHLIQKSVGMVGISSITLAELEYGIAKSEHKQQNAEALEIFLSAIEIFSFDDLAAEAYGKIRINLERAGTPIGAMDYLIAAHAISRGAVLVTNNIKEFNRIDNLKLENWLDSSVNIK